MRFNKTNAQSFEGVGFVEGNNNTQSQSVYTFTDTDVLPEQLYYYRLKQMDIGGGFDFSPIIAVRTTAGEQTVKSIVFPNPNKGSFTLSVDESGASTIKLYTATGLEIPINTTQTTNSKTVDISAKSALAPGLYYLKVNAADGAKTKALSVVVY